MTNWEQIKTEYITVPNTSYRQLAKKYKVPFSTLSQRAMREGWAEAKDKHSDSIVTQSIQQAAKKDVDRMSRLNDITDKLLAKIERSIDAIDDGNERAIKQIASAIKDIKDIQGCKTDRDIREQEARIRQLEKASEEQKQEPVKVVLTNQLEEWAE